MEESSCDNADNGSGSSSDREEPAGELSSASGESDRSQHDSGCLPFAVSDWPRGFLNFFVLRDKLDKQELHEIKLLSLCSGTDSGFHALQALIGSKAILAVSVDHNEAAHRFVTSNMDVLHHYGDMASINHNKLTFCCICKDTSGAIAEKCTYGLATIPCNPYSCLNVRRHMSDYEPFKARAARPFFDLRQFMEESPAAPRIMFLENVAGMLRKSKARGDSPTPLEFLLRGKITHGKGHINIGLKYIQRYHVSEAICLSARGVGLPMKRERIFILCALKDQYTETSSQPWWPTLRS